MRNWAGGGSLVQTFTEFLPPEAVELVRTRVTAEFATVSAAGVPIDTPTFFFPNAALTTLDIGTGVSYPAKAERARRNPKVGMLVEGEADQPVISIAGYAAVQDADIQANLERYLAETIFAPNVDPAVVPWAKTQQRLYYVSRIIVAVAPAHVRWWPNRAALDEPPQEWRAPAGTVFPASDPAPAGAPSKAPGWPQRDWVELADQASSSGMPAHLTLLDGGGHPLPFRVRECERTPEGFQLVAPRGAPWTEGKATLSFVGKEIFVGEARVEGAKTVFRVARALPVLPMMDDRQGMKPEVLEALSARLAEEMERRGKPLPRVPDTPPAPTEGAIFRAAAAKAIDVKGVGAGISK
jgi:hypothetical protein